MTSTTDTHDEKLSRSAKWILVITLSYAFNFSSIAFLPIYMRETLHSSLFMIGVALSTYGIGTIFASFYGAKLCDIYSSYLISCLSLLLFILGLVMIYFITQPLWLFIATLLIMGVANSSFLPAARMLLMRQTSEAAQLRANGLRYMFYNIGVAASLGVVGMLAHENYHVVVLFSLGFTCCALALLFIFVNNEKHNLYGQTITKKEKLRWWRDPFFTCIFAGVFIGMIVFAQLTSSMSLFLIDVYHFNMQSFSLFYIINCIIIGTMQMPIIKRIQHLPQVFIFMLAPSIMGLGYIVLLIKTSLISVTISMILITAGEMLFMPVSQNLVYQQAQNHLKGEYMGIYQALYAIAVIISPLIGTTALKIDHSGTVLWLFIFSLSILPIAGYVALKEKIPQLAKH